MTKNSLRKTLKNITTKRYLLFVVEGADFYKKNSYMAVKNVPNTQARLEMWRHLFKDCIFEPTDHVLETKNDTIPVFDVLLPSGLVVQDAGLGVIISRNPTYSDQMMKDIKKMAQPLIDRFNAFENINMVALTRINSAEILDERRFTKEERQVIGNMIQLFHDAEENTPLSKERQDLRRKQERGFRIRLDERRQGPHG